MTAVLVGLIVIIVGQFALGGFLLFLLAFFVRAIPLFVPMCHRCELVEPRL